MRSLGRLLVVVLFLALCVLPGVMMVVPIFEQKPLEGADFEKPRPGLTFQGLWHETFQRGFTAWFDQHYGAKPTLTRLDNSIGYYAFHETRSDKKLKIGKHDVLFWNEQIDHYNQRSGGTAPMYARRYKAAQDALRKQGIELIVSLEPTKPTVWEDAFPLRYALALPSPRPCHADIEDALRRELRASGADYVDGNVVLRGLMEHQKDVVYPVTARHLSPAAGCLVLAATLDVVRPRLRDWEIPAVDCTYDLRNDVALDDEQYDLFRVLNVWAPHPTTPITKMREVPETVPIERRPPTLVNGTSFGWQFVYQAERAHALGKLDYHFWGNTLVSRPGFEGRPMSLGSPEWKAMILTKKLVLFPVAEEFFNDAHNDFFVAVIGEFVDDPVLRKELLP